MTTSLHSWYPTFISLLSIHWYCNYLNVTLLLFFVDKSYFPYWIWWPNITSFFYKNVMSYHHRLVYTSLSCHFLLVAFFFPCDYSTVASATQKIANPYIIIICFSLTRAQMLEVVYRKADNLSSFSSSLSGLCLWFCFWMFDQAHCFWMHYKIIVLEL